MPGTKLSRGTDWEPFTMPVPADNGMPAGGRFGRDSPGPTGIARLRPELVRVAGSTGMKRYFPSDDHVGTQKLSHMRLGGPPSIGIAAGAGPLAPGELGTTAMTQRRPGETP